MSGPAISHRSLRSAGVPATTRDMPVQPNEAPATM
jgi:hypothetical protein